MTEYKCIKCDTTIEICCDSNGEELDTTDPNDTFTCEHCMLRAYTTEKVMHIAAGKEHTINPVLEELFNDKYTFISLRNYSGKW